MHIEMTEGRGAKDTKNKWSRQLGKHQEQVRNLINAFKVPKNIEGLRQDAGCHVSFTYHLVSAAEKAVKRVQWRPIQINRLFNKAGAVSLYLRINNELTARKPTAMMIYSISSEKVRDNSRILSRRRKLDRGRKTYKGARQVTKLTHLFYNLVEDAAISCRRSIRQENLNLRKR